MLAQMMVYIGFLLENETVELFDSLGYNKKRYNNYILIKIFKLPLCKIRCNKNFLTFYTVLFMVLTNALHAKI